MKKFTFMIFIILCIIIGLGVFYKLMYTSNVNKDEIKILKTLPFGIEPNNPVPQVRHWNLMNRTYYYFNWGLKPTGGYSLELVDIKKDRLIIKAISPQKDQMLIQTLTFPYLCLSLPKGHYQYQVINAAGQVVSNVFKPKNKAFKMTLYLPKDNQLARREIFREFTSQNHKKTKALIALEALFNQPETAGYINHGIFPKSVKYSIHEPNLLVELSSQFNDLHQEDKKLLSEMISKTILDLKIKSLKEVKIVSTTSD